MDNVKKSLWMCLAHVTPNEEDQLFENKKAQGGYIQLASEAKNKNEFLVKVKKALLSYGVTILDLEDVQIEEDGLLTNEMDEERVWMDVYFGYIHTY